MGSVGIVRASWDIRQEIEGIANMDYSVKKIWRVIEKLVGECVVSLGWDSYRFSNRTSTVCVAIALALMLSSVSQATLIVGSDKAGPRRLTKDGEDSSGWSLWITPAKTDSVFGPVLRDIGFIGSLLDLSIPLSSKIMIGSSSQNLAGYDKFAMTLLNNNEDIWTIPLHVDSGGSVLHSSRVVPYPGETALLASDITDLRAVASLGFVINSK